MRTDPAGERYELVIEGWHPTKLNQLIGCSYFVVGKRKRGDQEAITWANIQARLPQATGRRRVSLHLTLGPRQRAGDPDAYWKSLLDALVHAGLLKEDNRQWCALGEVTFDRGDRPRTKIVLEEVPCID